MSARNRGVDRNRIRATVLAATIAAGLAVSPSAQALVVAGTGLESCRSWAAWQSQGTALDPRQWVLGYLSGVTRGSSAPDGTPGVMNPLEGLTDVRVVWTWMDNYCRENPTDTIETAAGHFVAFAAIRALEQVEQTAFWLGIIGMHQTDVAGVTIFRY
jgi:hypothetical protein